MSAFRTVRLVPIALALCAPIACGDGSGGGAGGGWGEPIACCEAACSSQAGAFTIMAEGQPINPSGTATMVEDATGSVLYDGPLQGFSFGVDESDLAPFEDQTVMVTVSIDAEGYVAFEDSFSLSFERVEICCSSCISANDMHDIELVAEPTP